MSLIDIADYVPRKYPNGKYDFIVGDYNSIIKAIFTF